MGGTAEGAKPYHLCAEHTVRGLDLRCGADDVIAKLAAETRRFTGHVLHTVKDPVTQMDAIDPKTGQAVLVPTCATVITPKCLATFAHDRKWKGGDEVEVCHGLGQMGWRCLGVGAIRTCVGRCHME